MEILRILAENNWHIRIDRSVGDLIKIDAWTITPINTQLKLCVRASTLAACLVALHHEFDLMFPA